MGLYEELGLGKKRKTKALNKEAVEALADMIFSQTPEEKEAIYKGLNKIMNKNIQTMIDRGYDVTELVNELNNPPKT